MKKYKKLLIIVLFLVLSISGAVFFIQKISHTEKKTLAVQSLALADRALQFLPIKKDTKEIIHVAQQLSESVLREDGVVRTYLVLLQNNHELRPGGGFLGQYAIVKVKNGDIESLYVEDANLLDQRITAKVTPPYPFERMMSIKKWKFRDSNFSPDFPTNIEKIKYFYRLSGGSTKFDGVVAVNADVLNAILEITGPVQVPGYAATFTSEDAAITLEEIVEKAYLGDDVDPNAKQHRKDIMKQLASIIAQKAVTVQNIPELIRLAREQLENKNVMLYFEDESLQSQVKNVHWDGSVAQDWQGDYIMAVDANMGALKSDYYIDRHMRYEVDLTLEKPIATLTYTYTHNAPHGDWRTSDYHSYLRLYVPKGSTLLERQMVSYPNIQEEFGKTYFGFILHTLIGRQTQAVIKYELPEHLKNDETYQLLIQKQSGVKDTPVEIHVKTSEKEYFAEETLMKDLRLEFQ